jgi:hypothetical protein
MGRSIGPRCIASHRGYPHLPATGGIMLVPIRYRPVILSLLAAVAMTLPALASPSSSDSVAVADSGKMAWDDRFRLVGGGALVSGYNNGGLAFPFANVDYRWSSNVPGESGETRLGAGIEVGVNLLFPYFKAGPELRLGRTFLSAHAGMTTVFYVGGHDAGAGVMPFLGAAGGYCFGFGEVGLEMEGGINTGPYGDEGGSISYLALVLAFR